MNCTARVTVLIMFICGQIVALLISLVVCNNDFNLVKNFNTFKFVPYKGEFQQQHAKVLHANPKYVESVNIFTTRLGRKSPYVTDLNITLLGFWGNKFTTKTMYYKQKEKSQALIIEVKTCDILKIKWAKEWVEKYSNMTSECPVKPGSYRFSRFEIPPKNIPLPIGRGDYETSFSVYITKTKEVILELSMNIKSLNF